MAQKYYATGTMNTKDGVIQGTVSYNPSRTNKYQVNIDGELHGEHKTPEDAVDELKRSGFKNVKINESRLSTRHAKLIENYVRKQVRKNLNEARDSYDSGVIDVATDLAQKCSWDYEEITQVYLEALTDANAHSHRKKIQPMLNKIFGKEFKTIS